MVPSTFPRRREKGPKDTNDATTSSVDLDSDEPGKGVSSTLTDFYPACPPPPAHSRCSLARPPVSPVSLESEVSVVAPLPGDRLGSLGASQRQRAATTAGDAKGEKNGNKALDKDKNKKNKKKKDRFYKRFTYVESTRPADDRDRY